MSRCRIVGAFLTCPMLPYATDNAPPQKAGQASDRPVAAPGQLVRGVVPDERLPRVDALPVQLGQGALDIVPDDPHGDPEDALAALQQRVDLVGRGALVDRGPVA